MFSSNKSSNSFFTLYSHTPSPNHRGRAPCVPCDLRCLQWLDGRAPLAGDDLHELKAAVVELDLRGVVVLGVDLAGPQRTAVLGLMEETHTHTHTHTHQVI